MEVGGKDDHAIPVSRGPEAPSAPRVNSSPVTDRQSPGGDDDAARPQSAAVVRTHGAVVETEVTGSPRRPARPWPPGRAPAPEGTCGGGTGPGRRAGRRPGPGTAVRSYRRRRRVPRSARPRRSAGRRCGRARRVRSGTPGCAAPTASRWCAGHPCGDPADLHHGDGQAGGRCLARGGEAHGTTADQGELHLDPVTQRRTWLSGRKFDPVAPLASFTFPAPSARCRRSRARSRPCAAIRSSDAAPRRRPPWEVRPRGGGAARWR